MITDQIVATILFLIVFGTDGTPFPNDFTLDASHPCNAQVAAQYALAHVVPALPPHVQIQDPRERILWLCLPVPAGTPGPAMSTRHVPQDDEA